jgi:hypothetical protein
VEKVERDLVEYQANQQETEYRNMKAAFSHERTNIE